MTPSSRNPALVVGSAETNLADIKRKHVVVGGRRRGEGDDEDEAETEDVDEEEKELPKSKPQKVGARAARAAARAAKTSQLTEPDKANKGAERFEVECTTEAIVASLLKVVSTCVEMVQRNPFVFELALSLLP